MFAANYQTCTAYGEKYGHKANVREEQNDKHCGGTLAFDSTGLLHLRLLLQAVLWAITSGECRGQNPSVRAGMWKWSDVLWNVIHVFIKAQMVGGDCHYWHVMHSSTSKLLQALVVLLLPCKAHSSFGEMICDPWQDPVRRDICFPREDLTIPTAPAPGAFFLKKRIGVIAFLALMCESWTHDLGLGAVFFVCIFEIDRRCVRRNPTRCFIVFQQLRQHSSHIRSSNPERKLTPL